MRKTTGSRIIKLLSLAAVLVLMLALCGCRTRITNNNEVSDVMYDEDGNMQSEYDMRRDELSLSTAPKPVFTGFGRASDEEEDYDDEDMSAFDDYDPDAEEEDSEIEETEEDASGAGTSSKGTQSRVVKRKASNNKTANNGELTVKLEKNGGTCGVSAIKVKKGDKYTELDKIAITRPGYDFIGWHSKDDKDENTRVTSDTVVTASTNHTLYAQWEKQEEEKQSYALTFDFNAPEGREVTKVGDIPDKVTKGEVYPELPKATCKGFEFMGWFTDPDNNKGDQIEKGKKVEIEAPLSLYAHWEKIPKEYWAETLNEIVTPMKDEDKVRYQAGNGEESFLNSCGMKPADESGYDYIVFFGTKEEAATVENPEGKPILVIPKEAVKSTTKDEVVLLYKLKILNKIYTLQDDKLVDAIENGKVAEELGITESEIVDVL